MDEPLSCPENRDHFNGLSFETVPGGGHMIPITAPDACADFIRRMAAPGPALSR